MYVLEMWKRLTMFSVRDKRNARRLNWKSQVELMAHTHVPKRVMNYRPADKRDPCKSLK